MRSPPRWTRPTSPPTPAAQELTPWPSCGARRLSGRAVDPLRGADSLRDSSVSAHVILTRALQTRPASLGSRLKGGLRPLSLCGLVRIGSCTLLRAYFLRRWRRNSTALHGFDLTNCAAQRLHNWSLTHLPPEKMIPTLFAPCAVQLPRSFLYLKIESALTGVGWWGHLLVLLGFGGANGGRWGRGLQRFF